MTNQETFDPTLLRTPELEAARTAIIYLNNQSGSTPASEELLDRLNDLLNSRWADVPEEGFGSYNDSLNSPIESGVELDPSTDIKEAVMKFVSMNVIEEDRAFLFKKSVAEMDDYRTLSQFQKDIVLSVVMIVWMRVAEVSRAAKELNRIFGWRFNRPRHRVNVLFSYTIGMDSEVKKAATKFYRSIYGNENERAG